MRKTFQNLIVPNKITLIVAVLLAAFSYLVHQPLDLQDSNIITFQNITYFDAIHTYNISPYSVKNCMTLSSEEKSDFVVRKDINSISVIDSTRSECSVYSKGQIEYFMVCVQMTDKGWRDNCGVLSSEAWKKLFGSNNAFG